MQYVNIQSDSSRNASSKTLAPKTLLSALREFVNTGDEPKRIAYFLKRWPEFLDRDKVEGDAPLALRDVIVKPFIPKTNSPRYLMFTLLRDMVRDAWKGNEAMLGRLLNATFELDLGDSVVPDWRRGSFRYKPQNTFQTAVYELLKHSRQARVCANPDCANPYFLTLDPRRKFCSPECTKPAQKEWRRTWWEQHGKEWRKKRAKKSTKRRKPHGNN